MREDTAEGWEGGRRWGVGVGGVSCHDRHPEQGGVTLNGWNEIWKGGG